MQKVMKQQSQHIYTLCTVNSKASLCLCADALCAVSLVCLTFSRWHHTVLQTAESFVRWPNKIKVKNILLEAISACLVG